MAIFDPLRSSRVAVPKMRFRPIKMRLVADHKEEEEGKQAKGQAQKVEVEWEA
jgi:hypothetical protein